MMPHPDFLKQLRSEQDGTMLVETALVAPMLVLLCLGSFQVSSIIARQTELESAAAEAAAIALSAAPDTDQERATVKSVIAASTGLDSTRVSVTAAYRCNSETAYVTDKSDCSAGQVTNYARISLSDTYEPAWTRFGVGSPITYQVNRYVLFSQEDAV
jgi:Flp pilus assembly protein TadG